MYRLLSLLLLFNFALGHFHHDFHDDFDDDDSDFNDSGPGPGPNGPYDSGPDSGPDPDGPGWGHPWHEHPAESNFDKLARYVISTDKKVLSICKQSPYSRAKVLAGVAVYSLKYSLPEFNENGIKVQIKHRVISVTAEAQGVAPFKDLRIIPDIVKATDASWVFDQGTLTVSMPYKNPLNTEVALGCTSDINETVIDVPNTGISNDDLRIFDS